jgi:hypothetical protein
MGSQWAKSNLDSSDKPLSFYQRPLSPEELSEQKAAMLSLKNDKKPSPIQLPHTSQIVKLTQL